MFFKNTMVQWCASAEIMRIFQHNPRRKFSSHISFYNVSMMYSINQCHHWRLKRLKIKAEDVTDNIDLDYQSEMSDFEK